MARAAVLLAALSPLIACDPLLPPPDPRTVPGGRAVVRVVSWNAHDLFDAEDRLVAPGALDTVPTPAEADAKLERVAAVLRRLDADLVLLQEVENEGVLDALAERAGYPEARLVEGPDPRGIDVAAMARLPVAAYVSHAADRDPSGAPLWPRDCVEVHVRLGARRLVVVSTHASSRLSDDGTRRAFQAARLRELADALRADDPGALVLAGGDLNDPPEAPAIAPLVGDGAWVDPLPAGAFTWRGAQGEVQLDALLVARADAGTIVSAWAADGEDVRRASDHLPVVVDLALP
jgi:uncharacterized protein